MSKKQATTSELGDAMNAFMDARQDLFNKLEDALEDILGIPMYEIMPSRSTGIVFKEPIHDNNGTIYGIAVGYDILGIISDSGCLEVQYRMCVSGAMVRTIPFVNEFMSEQDLWNISNAVLKENYEKVMPSE